MNMAKRLAHGQVQGSQKYLPQMQKDVDNARKVFERLKALEFFEKHVMANIDYAIKENIITPSEVEKPGEKDNRRLLLLMLYNHVIDLPPSIARHIHDDLVDYLYGHELDSNPKRDWAEYSKVIRNPDKSLKIAALAHIAEKARYKDTERSEFYGVSRESHPGLRLPEDWEAEKKTMAEPDLVVWRRLANIFGYRTSYNQIGENALENSEDKEMKDLLNEARMGKAHLADASKRTQDALKKLIGNVCQRLTSLGISFTIEPIRTKGAASIALKLKEYRSRPIKEPQDRYRNRTVANINDFEAVRIVILRKPGVMTEDLRGVRIAEKILFEEADKMRESGEFPFYNVKLKDYINNPKPNGFRSDNIDFTLARPFEQNPEFVDGEVQICTDVMDHFNRFGGPAHIAYKDGKEYENVSGVVEFRKTILGNIDSFLADLSSMQGKPNGSKYQPFPRNATTPVTSMVELQVRKADGSCETLKVGFQIGDLALDVLARSGFDIQDHKVVKDHKQSEGKSFGDPVSPDETLYVVESIYAVNPALARGLYRSKTSYKQFTRNKLAEIFQNGDGKSGNRKKKGGKKKRSG